MYSLTKPERTSIDLATADDDDEDRPAKISSTTLKPKKTRLKVPKKKPLKLAEPFHFLVTFSITIQIFCCQSIQINTACKFHFNGSVCDAMNKHNDFSKEVEEQAQMTAAMWNMIGNSGFAICSIISSNVLGHLTDRRLSKRTALSMVALGSTVCSLYLIVADHLSMHVGSYFLPSVLILYTSLAGMFASTFVVLSTVNAYLAAVLNPSDNRTLRFAYLQTVYFAAQIIGPYTAGTMINHFSRSSALCLSMISGLLAFTYTVAFLQNTPNVLDRREKQRKMLFVIHPNTGVRVLLLSCCLITIAYSGATSFSYLYIRRRPFSFTDMQAGRFLSAFQLVQTIGLLALIPIFTKKLKLRDITMVFIGLTGKLIYFLALGLAQNRIMLYSALTATLFLCIDGASVRSIIISLVEPHEHGEVFGMQSSFQSLGFLISQICLQPLYRASVRSRLPGSVFILSSAIILITILMISIFANKGVFRRESQERYHTQEIQPNEFDNLVGTDV